MMLVETPTYDLMDEDREDQERQARKVRFDDEPSSSRGDSYIGAEVTLPASEKWTSGRVKRRKCNPDGSDLGCANANPILDTRVYEVEFEDGGSDGGKFCQCHCREHVTGSIQR